jgi:Kef-type K+ transport system membrane component KefB
MMPNLLNLLIQIGVILMVARGVGFLFRRIHQPQVMGEMMAGILLGPSFLGWLAPGLSAALFPPESLGFLSVLSQFGLLLFMFLIGLELDLKSLQGHKRTALMVSQASITAPFLLGILLAFFLYPRLSDENVSILHFMLFIGAAMSITAFPLLARILTERNMLRTTLGALAISAAAINDVAGWIILAVVVVLVRVSEVSIPLWLTMIGLVVYLLLVFYPIRWLLGRVDRYTKRKGHITHNILALLLLFVLLSAWTTEWLGVHAMFGAFLAGVVMPKSNMLVHGLAERLNDLAVVLLLPIYFAITGLRASIGLVNGLELWALTLLIILVATLGKFGGTVVAARWSGMPWRESSALGILMNTRGLMELVLLNIGLDLGVISPTLFTMMLLMALVTTFLTAPLLEWIYFSRLVPQQYPAAPVDPVIEAAFPPDSILGDLLVEPLESNQSPDGAAGASAAEAEPL